MGVRAGPHSSCTDERRLSTEELMFLNSGDGEDS